MKSKYSNTEFALFMNRVHYSCQLCYLIASIVHTHLPLSNIKHISSEMLPIFCHKYHNRTICLHSSYKFQHFNWYTQALNLQSDHRVHVPKAQPTKQNELFLIQTNCCTNPWQAGIKIKLKSITGNEGRRVGSSDTIFT